MHGTYNVTLNIKYTAYQFWSSVDYTLLVFVIFLHQKVYQQIIFDILDVTKLEKLRPYMPVDSTFSCKVPCFMYGPGIQIS